MTALYEIVPARGGAAAPAVDPLRYQADAGRAAPAQRRAADGEAPLQGAGGRREPAASVARARRAAAALDGDVADFRFAAAVAAFGMVLRRSSHRGQASYALARQLAEGRRCPPMPTFTGASWSRW